MSIRSNVCGNGGELEALFRMMWGDNLHECVTAKERTVSLDFHRMHRWNLDLTPFLSFSYCNSASDFTLIAAFSLGRLNPDFPNSLQPCSKESLFWDEPGRLQLVGVTQPSSGSGNFPEHLRGHSPLWLPVCLRTNPQNSCHPKPQWHRSTPLFGFPLLYFSLR